VETWNVSVVAEITKYSVRVLIPVVVLIAVKITESPLRNPCAVAVTRSPTSVNVTDIVVAAALLVTKFSNF
jgi:hypothetical protein